MMLDNRDNRFLTDKARWVRSMVLDMCAKTKSGHIASSLSCSDILVALYYGGVLRFNPKEPCWQKRDRFIISKGHGAVALYPILADNGLFPADELIKFCQPRGILGVHPDQNIPGIEVVSGSLGHGLGIGAGIALAAKMDRNDYKTVVLLGDGECYEGSVWEAAMFAAHHKLDNITAVIDRNGMCVTEYTEEGLRLEPFAAKWLAFGWDVFVVNGHDFTEILSAFSDFHNRKSLKPLVIIANTVKGKGLSCMENKANCHTKVPSGEELESAKSELVSDTIRLCFDRQDMSKSVEVETCR